MPEKLSQILEELHNFTTIIVPFSRSYLQNKVGGAQHVLSSSFPYQLFNSFIIVEHLFLEYYALCSEILLHV